MNTVTANYYFSHKILKELLLLESELAMNIILQGKEVLEEFLKNLWQEVRNSENIKEEKFNDSKIKFYSSEIDSGEYVVVLDMPTNNCNGDCYFICFNFNELGDIMYFTYENLNSKYYICQWENLSKHKILKKTNNLDIDDFIEVITKEVVKSKNLFSI